MKKNIKVRPYLENARQIREGMSETSWVAFSLSTDKTLEVTYFNPEINPEEFETFFDFVQAIKDDFSCSGDNVSYSEKILSDCFVIQGSNTVIDDDFINGHKVDTASTNSSITKIYEKGISFLNIFDKAKEIKNDLNLLDKSESDLALDSNKAQKDPYSYYGAAKKHI